MNHRDIIVTVFGHKSYFLSADSREQPLYIAQDCRSFKQGFKMSKQHHYISFSVKDLLYLKENQKHWFSCHGLFLSTFKYLPQEEKLF